MYLSRGTATLFTPMFLRVSPRVYPTETTTLPGIWRWTSMLYSLDEGHCRFGAYRLFVPNGKPLDMPSSFSCGIRSPLRSHPDVCPGVHTVHTRVSFTMPSGFTRCTLLSVIG